MSDGTKPLPKVNLRIVEDDHGRMWATNGPIIEAYGTVEQIRTIHHAINEYDALRSQRDRLADAVLKYIVEKENVVPDLTLIRHTFQRLKEALASIEKDGKE